VHECHDQLHEQGRGRNVNLAGLMCGRFARERLWALAQAAGRVEKTKPEVLFVCPRDPRRHRATRPDARRRPRPDRERVTRFNNTFTSS
jgi:hypothetical protein